jgi:hypothetical protein
MTLEEDDRAPLVAAMRALGDHLRHLVVVGGWAQRLHRLHDGLSASTPILYTEDLDLALRRPPAAADPPLDRRLVNAGFREIVKGDSEGITEYVWERGASAMTVEFLVHRVGKESAAVLDVGGALAQRLRHLDVAFIKPWELEVSRDGGFPCDEGEVLRLQVANPAAFLMNKLLTYQRRRELYKKGKDLLYVYDEFQLFESEPDLLESVWLETLRDLPRSTLKSLRQQVDALPRASLIADEAARIADSSGRSVSADRLLATCIYGFNGLLV